MPPATKAAGRGTRRDSGAPKAKNDAYTGILAISLLALVIGCVFLYLDLSQYTDGAKPKAPPQPFPKGGTPAPPGGDGGNPGNVGGNAGMMGNAAGNAGNAAGMMGNAGNAAGMAGANGNAGAGGATP